VELLADPGTQCRTVAAFRENGAVVNCTRTLGTIHGNAMEDNIKIDELSHEPAHWQNERDAKIDELVTYPIDEVTPESVLQSSVYEQHLASLIKSP
jgi:hypothetical protein